MFGDPFFVISFLAIEQAYRNGNVQLPGDPGGNVQPPGDPGGNVQLPSDPGGNVQLPSDPGGKGHGSGWVISDLSASASCRWPDWRTVSSFDYLLPGFDPKKLTVVKLRSILADHEVKYPPTAKKAQLIALFEEHVAPLAAKILAADTEVKRSDERIEDAGL
jgi:hypothetical protein